MTAIRIVAETHSTNDDVAALAREGAAEGLWLRALAQKGGRGRHGRAWQSPEGNLYASTLVRLREDDPPAPTLALVAAIALQETASAYAPDQRLLIKWPNDLLACSPAQAGAQPLSGPRPSGTHQNNTLMGSPSPGNEWSKLAGILLERADDAVIIGFGVNLAFHPEGLDRTVTSLAALAGSAPDAVPFLETLAESFARWLRRWRGEGVAPIRTRWLLAAHPVGTALSTHAGEERVDGLFDGLTPDGALRLRLADGSARVIHAGDVFLI